MPLKDKEAFFAQLSNLYKMMDNAWDEAASHYGFKCRGCGENCCETNFYHHTLIEKQYLLKGFAGLDRDLVKKIRDSAARVCEKRAEARLSQENIRIMCPLNKDGWCLLYAYRPMICRLHGIPHELCRPGSSVVRMPGCSAGEPLFKARPYFKFDRTVFYSRMAELEMAFRQFTGKREKIKQTVAEMLLG
ncbi:MAG: hypothetical protein R6U68_14455 [Desulfobacteraceae bacterium]